MFNRREKRVFLTVVGELFPSPPGEGETGTGRLGLPCKDFLDTSEGLSLLSRATLDWPDGQTYKIPHC